MTGSRSFKNQRIRKRRRKLLFSIVFVLFLSMIGYSAYEYAAGKRIATEAGGIGDTKQSEQNKNEFENRAQIDDSSKKAKDNKVNVLLVGSDQRENEISRTDTIMIAQYNTSKGTAKLVSILRDTFVNIPGYGYDRINSSYSYGNVALLTETIEKNFGVHIDDYAIVNFEGFKHIVDTIAPKGIKIDVAKRMKYQDGAGTININLYPGEQRLNGDELLGYARFRNDQESDFGRVRRQQEVISKLKEQLLSVTSVPKFPKTVGMLTSYIDTSMGTNDMINYGTKFIMDPVQNIETLRIPAEGNWWPHTTANGAEVLAHDEKVSRKMIQEFLNIEQD